MTVDNSITEEIFDRKVTQAIDAKKHQMREALKEIEGNTRKNYEAHIAYHKYMMEAAKEQAIFRELCATKS